MKQLAFGGNNIDLEAIKPDKNIIYKKQPCPKDYFEIESTGAKVSLKESSALIDLFCKSA